MQLMEVLREAMVQIELWVNPNLAITFSALLFFIALVGTHPIRVTDEKGLLEIIPIYIRKIVFISAVVLLTSAPIVLYFLSQMAFSSNEPFFIIMKLSLELLINSWWLLLGSYFVPATWRWILNRFLPTYLSSIKRRFSVRVSKDSLSDIRAEVKNIKSKNFDVRKHYKDGFMFLGLDADNQPILIKDSEFITNNINCIGPSQTGKGVLQQVIIDQAIRKNWNVFFIDQKPDDFIPDVMRETCEEVERQLITLDFTGESKGSYCPFNGGTNRERLSRIFGACGLSDGGTDSDFYKGQERAALSEILPHWNGSIRQLDEFLHSNKSSIAEKLGEYKTNQAREALNKVKSQLIEWKHLEAINAKSGRGFDVERTIKNNGVAIIRGSVSDKLIIKFTKVIIDEIISTILRLGKKNKAEHTLLVIDEARFIISDELAKALATMLSKGCSTMINYQSVKDTENLDDKTINAKSISQSILVNTNYTICYRAKDPETAEWLSNQTGTIQKSVSRMENVERNRHGGEVWSPNKTLNDVEENYMHSNLVMSLPQRVCVFLKPNALAQICYTNWLPVKKPLDLPPKNTAPNTVKKTAPNTVKKTAPNTVKKTAPNTVKKTAPNTVKKDSANNLESKPQENKPPETLKDLL